MTAKFESAFCTIDEVIRLTGLQDQSPETLSNDLQTLIANTATNQKVAFEDLIKATSSHIEQTPEIGRTFEPYEFTYQYLFNDDPLQNRLTRISAGVAGNTLLQLSGQDDLLQLNTLVWNGATIDSADFSLLPSNQFPARSINAKQSAIINTPVDYTSSIDMTGIWGYHNNPDAMFKTIDTGITLADAIGTTFTATPANIAQYELLSLLRIENEYLRVTAVDTNTNIVTVERGVRGTTASDHTSQAVERYQQTRAILNVTRDLVVKQFNARGGFGGILQGQFATGDGSTRFEFPSPLPKAIPRRPIYWSA
jgi:hypothetical protein